MRLKAVDALRALLFAGVFGASTSAAAGPVVVELFTSQGCNSCPPADEILGELAEKPDVIALSLNVDYWDYLGWKDEFAKAAHTSRQRDYQSSFGARTIYTPQMVLQGETAVVGNQAIQVMTAMDVHQSNPNEAEVTLSRDGGQLLAQIEPVFANLEGPATIWLIGYTGPHAVPIGRGENAGRTITYYNVVREMRQVDEWDASSSRQFRLDIDDNMRGYAVLVQKDLVGRIYGAGKIEF